MCALSVASENDPGITGNFVDIVFSRLAGSGRYLYEGRGDRANRHLRTLELTNRSTRLKDLWAAGLRLDQSSSTIYSSGYGLDELNVDISSLHKFSILRQYETFLEACKTLFGRSHHEAANLLSKANEQAYIHRQIEKTRSDYLRRIGLLMASDSKAIREIEAQRAMAIRPWLKRLEGQPNVFDLYKQLLALAFEAATTPCAMFDLDRRVN